MRIERVVAGTFNEASERSRRLYGPNVLLISSSRVGNSHELLVCTDAANDEEMPVVGPAARDEFVSALQQEMQSPPSRTRIEQTEFEPVHIEPKNPEGDVDGAALVGLIRRELQALETRLTAGTVVSHGLQEKMALLEQGVSAAYATRLIESGLDAASMSTRLLDDLSRDAVGPKLGERAAVFLGPAAGGKTTAAIQATLLIAASKGVPAVVSASRDPRPGAREKFFAMADAARIESSWGGVASGSLVVDAGGYRLEDLAVARPELNDYDLYLCIPAYFNRGAALRWFDCVGQMAGVILTHWSPTEVPLGLLGSMAERGVPLVGLSTSADPSVPLARAAMDTIRDAVRHAFELTLEMPSSGVE